MKVDKIYSIYKIDLKVFKTYTRTYDVPPYYKEYERNAYHKRTK